MKNHQDDLYLKIPILIRYHSNLYRSRMTDEWEDNGRVRFFFDCRPSPKNVLIFDNSIIANKFLSSVAVAVAVIIVVVCRPMKRGVDLQNTRDRGDQTKSSSQNNTPDSDLYPP